MGHPMGHHAVAHHAPLLHHAPVAHHAVAHHAPIAHHAVAHHAPVVAHAVHHAAPVVHAVADDYSKSNFNAAESNDGTGVVEGSYSVALPGGRVQHVAYHANDIDGYVAEVTYDGQAVYPETVAVAHA